MLLITRYVRAVKPLTVTQKKRASSSSQPSRMNYFNYGFPAAKCEDKAFSATANC